MQFGGVVELADPLDESFDDRSVVGQIEGSLRELLEERLDVAPVLLFERTESRLGIEVRCRQPFAERDWLRADLAVETVAQRMSRIRRKDEYVADAVAVGHRRRQGRGHRRLADASLAGDKEQ